MQVGTAGTATALFHQFAPFLTEKLMGKQTHMAQMEKAEPAPMTDGGLLEPTPAGTGVTGGWLNK